MNQSRIRLSEDFSPIRFAPENADRIAGSLAVNDIFSDWKKAGATVDLVKQNVEYYVGYLCSEATQEKIWKGITQEYRIMNNGHYCVAREGEWIGALTHRQFRHRSDERSLGNLGIELFDAYCDQGLGTALIAQWLAHVQKVWGLPGLSACCNEDNLRSKAVLSKLGDRARKCDYVDALTGDSREAFFLR